MKTSTLDFPKVLACVLFTTGCNMNCFYCHNRQLINGKAEDIYEKEILDFLYKRKSLLDGVVISGGEPTLQPDLKIFLCKVKDMGYKIKLDTNGSNPEVIKEIISSSLLDYIAIDYKAPKRLYPEICAFSPDKVLESIDILKNSHINYELRTTLYPTLTILDLFDMLKEVPVAPVYRINYYIKPANYEKNKEVLINSDFLRPYDLEKELDKLTSIQPNIII